MILLAVHRPMIPSNWRDSVTAFIRAEALPVDKYGHQPRLYALARRVAEGLEYDDDVLFAAAWMHDLGVFAGHRPRDPDKLARWDHLPYTLALTRELLAQWGFPTAKLDRVHEAIRTHQPQDEPRVIEGILLHDADILEQLGAVGVLRAVAKIGCDTRYPTFSAVLPVLLRAADQLPGKLHLTNAQQLAKPRVEALRAFLSAVENEAGDLLF
jgi:uncharacterized protein